MHSRLTLRVAIEQLSNRVDQLHRFITEHGLEPPPMDNEDHHRLLRVLDYQRLPYTILSKDLRPQKTPTTSSQELPSLQAKSDSPPVSMVATSDQDTVPQQHDHLDSFPIFDIVENQPNVNTYPATNFQILQSCYQESWDKGGETPSGLTCPQYANAGTEGIRPLSEEETREFSSPGTNKSTGETDETEALVDQLSDRIGTLQVGARGHIRYYGPTSNFNLAQLPFPDVYAVFRTIRNDGKDVLERLGLNKPIPAALEEHLTKLYFTWQDPTLHVVNRHMFYLARSRWEDGEESPYYSESLQNALCVLFEILAASQTNCRRCALGGAFETRHHPDLITFPRSLAEFFADRAKSLLEIELDNPSVATIQALAVLSSHDIGHKRDSRGWLYSGRYSLGESSFD